MINHKYFQGLLSFFTVLGISLSPLQAIERRSSQNIRPDELVKEVFQINPLNDEALSLTWWLPFESFGLGHQSEILVIVAKVKPKRSNPADIEYASEAEIRQGLRVRYTSPSGKSIPLKLVSRSGNMNDLILELRPFFSKFAGDFGNGLRFFTFNNIDASGKDIVSPYESGKLDIFLDSGTARQTESSIELPLNSLFVPRVCPNGKPANVTWKYCPWDGSPLSDK